MSGAASVPPMCAVMTSPQDLQQGLLPLRLGLGLIARGGKAVMAYALNPELNKPLRTLTVVDMSPAQGKISPE